MAKNDDAARRAREQQEARIRHEREQIRRNVLRQKQQAKQPPKPKGK